MASDIGEEIVWSATTGWPAAAVVVTYGLIGRLAEANGYPVANVPEPDPPKTWPKKKKKNPATGLFETTEQNPNDEINAADGPNKDIADTQAAVAGAIQTYCDSYFTLLEDHEELVARVNTLESTVEALQTALDAHEAAAVSDAHPS